MTALRDIFISKIRENSIQIFMQGSRKIDSETASAISHKAVA